MPPLRVLTGVADDTLRYSITQRDEPYWLLRIPPSSGHSRRIEQMPAVLRTCHVILPTWAVWITRSRPHAKAFTSAFTAGSFMHHPRKQRATAQKNPL